MLTSDLLTRSTGLTSTGDFARSQNARLIHALQPAPRVRFAGEAEAGNHAVGSRGDDGSDDNEEVATGAVAHKAGVNCITVDKFEGR